MGQRNEAGEKSFTSRKNHSEQAGVLKIIAVTDRRLCREDFLNRIRTLAEAGIDALLLREKDMTPEEYSKLAALAREICERQGVAFIPHHFYEVAVEMDTKYLHLPGNDFLSLINDKYSYYRDLQARCKIGVSVHSLKEAQFAQRNGAAYLTAGHIFSTNCKEGLEPRGLPFLKAVCEAVTLPVYGIGGIESGNVAGVLATGAKGVCLMSSLMTCKAPASEVAKIRRMET